MKKRGAIKIKTKKTKLLAAVTASVCLLASCGTGANEKEAANSVEYSCIQIALNADMYYINQVKSCSDKCLFWGKSRGNKSTMFNAPLSLEDFSEADLQLTENEDITLVETDSDDNIWLISCLNKETYYLLRYDSELNLSFREQLDLPSKEVVLSDLVALGDSDILICGTDYSENKMCAYIVNDGSASDVEVSDVFDSYDWIEDVESFNGSIAVSYYSDQSERIDIIDAQTMKCSETIDVTFSNGVTKLIRSYDDKALYAYTGSGIYEKKDKSAFSELLLFSDVGINGSETESAVSIREDAFFVVSNDSSVGIPEGYLISRDEPSEHHQLQYVTLGAAYTDSELNRMIAEYNKKSADFKVKVVDYSRYNDESLDIQEIGASTQLNLDVVSGKAPDMLLTNQFTTAESLMQKGCFTDLYKFIDDDSELERDTFLANVLKNNEVDSNLPFIPIDFSVDTIVGKAKYVGNTENWKTSDLISCYRQYSDKMELMQDVSRNTLIETLFYGNINSFIDYKSKTCRLDSDELVDILEFAAEFPYYDNNSGSMDAYLEDKMFGMMNDKYLLRNENIHSFEGFHELQAGIFNNEEITFVGYPSDNGKGAIINYNIGFSILKTSEHKNECWDFIRSFLTDDSEFKTDNFPVNISALNKRADEAMTPPTDSETGEEIKENYMDIGGSKKDIGFMSQEERERYISYLSAADSAIVLDYEVYRICMDEVASYLAGNSTAEKAAVVMQNRVDIYINE